MKVLKTQTFVLVNVLSFLASAKQLFAQRSTPLGEIDPIGIGEVVVSNDPKDVGPFATRLEQILSMVISFLTILAGLWFLVTFIVAGLGWATAGGDAKKVEDAKQKMTNGAVGLIIIIASYSVMYVIGEVLGINILNPAEEIPLMNVTGGQ